MGRGGPPPVPTSCLRRHGRLTTAHHGAQGRREEYLLEIAIGVTGAERGSLMLLEPGGRELAVRVAVGLEPELWPKVRVMSKTASPYL